MPGTLSYARVRLDRYHAWPMTIATIPLIAMAPRIRNSDVARATPKTYRHCRGNLPRLCRPRRAYGDRKILVRVVALATPRGSGITIRRPTLPTTSWCSPSRPAQSGEPIFSGVTRHDRIFGNDLLIHFLTDRPAATPSYELNRALMANEAVPAAISNYELRERSRSR